MITAKSRAPKYQVFFTDGLHQGVADTTADKGGGNSGFRPHDLLEAALATCLNIWLSMFANNHGIPVAQVETRVSLDRSRSDEVIFNYSIDISGALSGSEKQKLLSAARTCPVHKTLAKKLTLKAV